MRIINTIYSMLFNRCPQCHSGQVFKTKNPYELDKIFEMHQTCSHCGLKFEKETGFFYGALYVSYALTSGWFLTWFILYLTVLNWETLYFALFVSGTLIILSPLAIRWSRLIWLNFFYKFKKELRSTFDSQSIEKIRN